MTISTTTLLNSFSGNGSVVDFTYTYPINSASELLVIIKTDATGAETTKTLTSDYTVALAGDSGGTVTMGTAPASGETLFLIRNTTKTQGTDLIENDPFSAEGLEDSFDNLQMQIQEVSNAVDRSFKVSKTNSITTSEITTSAADRANKILSFDASGNVEATAFTNLDTLNEMTDVTITSPADNEVLAYDSSSTHFINQTPAEAGLVATGAVTGITSLLATDIKIGEDNETKIDFETADEIHFYAANAEQAYVADGVFGPQTDSDVDLGTTSVRWKDAYIDSITTTGNITSAGTVSFGSITDGTITATAFVDEDDMSSDSATLIPTQQSVKAYVDSKKADMQFVLEDGDGTEVQIVKDSEVKFVEGGGIDINWTDTSTGSDADPFDLTFAIDSTVTTLTGSQTLTNKTLTSPVLNTGVSGTAVKDEDNMASDSATHLATQQSIKAYVDAVTTSLNAQDLDVSDGSSAIGIDLDTETLGILGGTGLTSSASGNNVTLSVDAAQTQITSVGALDAGSITSGFGNIDNGSSTITTTGAVSTGALSVTGASTITTADNTDTLSLVSTDADGNSGPNLRLYRNNDSNGDGDVLGQIDFEGRNDNSQDVVYARIRAVAEDITDGTEDARLIIEKAVNGSTTEIMRSVGSETVFNDGSIDLDFRVESDGNTHALFVDAGNNRVGINNSSPSQALDITGNLVISGISRFGNGSAASPAYQFGDDTNTGMFRASSDTLGFSTAGSEALRIAADGDVGVGTVDPTQNLELVVSKTASIPTDASVGSTNNGAACGMGIHNENNSAVYSGLNFETRTTHASRWLMGNEWKSSYNGDLFFRARDGASSSSEILRLKSDGTVGIGTASPSTKLTIDEGGEPPAEGMLLLQANSSSRQLRIQPPTNADNGFIDYRGGNLVFMDDGTEVARFQGTTGFGIGTSSPQTTFNVNGVSRFDNYIEFGGTISTPSTAAAIYRPADNTLAFSTANTERMRIDSSGKVGIGTSSPSATLHVDASGGGVIRVSRNSSSTSNFMAIEADGTNGTVKAVQSLIISTGGSESMRVDTSGNLGIGTSSPINTSNYAGLSLNSTTGGIIDFIDDGTQKVRIVGSNAEASIQYTGNFNLVSGLSGGSEVLRVDSSGLVGIGTASPGSLLTVEGTSVITDLKSTNNNYVLRIKGNNATNGVLLGSTSSDDFLFATGTTERMRINSSGKVGIGETSPLGLVHIKTGDSGASAHVSADELVVEGSANSGINILSGNSSEGGIYFGDDGDNDVGRIRYDHTNNSLDFFTNATERMHITTDGHVRINTTASEETAKFCVATTAVVSELRNTNASYGSDSTVESIACLRSSNSNYRLLRGVSGNGSSTLFADNEFIFQGNGDLSVDGSVGTGGADYAEMFEWKDGNSSNEDRRGYSVVLDGNKIVKATDSDDTSKIIGIVSAMPVVIGDSDIDDKWRFKYLKDDFGNYVMEDYTVTEWTEVVEEGDDIEHSYATDRIPDGITAPSDATVIVTEKDGASNTINLQRKKLNPDWDNSKTYIRRKDRKEWDAIGLMGKLRMLKGQPTGTNWIKMRDISSSVEEWLVR